MTFSLLHILKKDFRLCWRYLAAWWALLVLRAFYITVGIDRLLHPVPLPVYHPGDSDAPYSAYQNFLDFLPEYMILFSFIGPIILFYIVSLVLKADSPIDEKALWRTRPVARMVMLRAKLLFLALFCVLPQPLMETALRLHYGMDASECLRGFVETAVILAAWISIAASAALLFKRTMTGLLAYTAIAIAGGYVYAAIVHYKWLDGFFFRSPIQDVLGIGAWFVFFTLVVATMLVVASQMYGGACQWRGAKILVGGLALSVGLAFLWRLALLYILSLRAPLPSANSAPLALHNLATDATAKPPVQVYSEFWDGAEYQVGAEYRFNAEHNLYGSLSTQTFPELKDKVLLVKQVKALLTWPDPNNEPLPYATEYPFWGNAPFLNQSAAFAAAGYGRLAWDPLNDRPQSVLFFLNNAQFKRAVGHTAKWSGQLTGESGHFVQVADLVPRQGGSWRYGNLQYSFGYGGYGPYPEKRWINFYFNEIGPTNYLLASPFINIPHVFLLYNSRTKECIEDMADGLNLDHRSAGNESIFSVFHPYTLGLRFNFSQKLDENSEPVTHPMSDDEIKHWVSDAHLIVLRFVPDQPLSCTLTIDPFVVPKEDTPQ